VTATSDRERGAVADKQEWVRTLNAQIRLLSRPSGDGSPSETQLDFVCECPRQRCFAVVPMTLDEWGAATSEPGYYVAHPEHVGPDDVAVVAGDRYAVALEREGVGVLTQVEPQKSEGVSSCERTVGESETEVVGGIAVETAVRNKRVFRGVNERMAELTTTRPDGLDVHLLICECSNDGCAESIEITPAEYASVLAQGNRFIVVAGHQAPEIDQVVGGNGRFLVVETMPLPQSSAPGEGSAS